MLTQDIFYGQGQAKMAVERKQLYLNHKKHLQQKYYLHTFVGNACVGRPKNQRHKSSLNRARDMNPRPFANGVNLVLSLKAAGYKNGAMMFS